MEYTEDELVTRQRTYDLGKRYGYLDGKAGVTVSRRQVPQSVPDEYTELYEQGYGEGFDAGHQARQEPS